MRIANLIFQMSNLNFCPGLHVSGITMLVPALASRHVGTLWEKNVKEYLSKYFYFMENCVTHIELLCSMIRI